MLQYRIEENTQRQMKAEECSICCQLKPRSTSGIDLQRPLEICYECWYNHILSTVNRITYRAGDDILSPFLHGEPTDIVTCLNSLNSAQAQQIEEGLFRKYTSFNKQIQKCPSESCDFVYVGVKCKWNHPDNIYNCPKCDMPLIANQSLSVKTALAAAYLLMANKCPKCEIPIQKISGCPHMTCPCGHQFCWYCYKDHSFMRPQQRIYQIHNVKECVFIFLSKIVLFFICLFSLLLTVNGNSTIKFCLGILGTIFSVLCRVVVLDLVILLQVIVFMMNRRRPVSLRSRKKENPIVLGVIIVNLAFILFLYMLGQLYFFLLLIMAEILVVGAGFGVGYAVVYSVETWFEYIA